MMARWTFSNRDGRSLRYWLKLRNHTRNKIREFLEDISNEKYNQLRESKFQEMGFRVISRNENESVFIGIIDRYFISISNQKDKVKVEILRYATASERVEFFSSAFQFDVADEITINSSNISGFYYSIPRYVDKIRNNITQPNDQSPLQRYNFSGNFTSSTNLSQALQLFANAKSLANELGFEFYQVGDLKSGSWFQRLKMRLGKIISDDEMKVKTDAVEDVLFGHANIDVDSKVVQMICQLISSLDSHNAAVVNSGMFLFIKIPDGESGGSIFSKRLTVEDRSILN